MHLVVGLGNPGKVYEKTRHNVGFAVLQALAQKYRFAFRKRILKWKGVGVQGEIASCPVALLMPLTFMNESGQSVVLAMRSFQIRELSHLLVVVDDAAIPFGQLRLRPQGSSGGHNGLKSIELHLQSNNYPRLRVGIGRGEEELERHVLGQFSREEEGLLPEVLERAVRAVELWLEKGISHAMDFVNPSNPSYGE